MLVKIVKFNNRYNWEGYDNNKICVYGKTFSSKREAKQDVKRYIKENNLKNWHYETLLTKVWGYLCRIVR